MELSYISYTSHCSIKGENVFKIHCSKTCSDEKSIYVFSKDSVEPIKRGPITSYTLHSQLISELVLLNEDA